MKATVFIHTNHRQMIGALVSEYTIKRNSKNPDKFDVQLIHTKDYPFLKDKEGQEFLRDGYTRPWRYEDLQSFTPLRFMPPELMGYEGRAVIMDPDIFAVGDIWELLSRDMGGHAIMCRARSGAKGREGCMASSVMLLECAKLTHWKCEEQFNKLFTGELDYMDWICLRTEPRESIGMLEPYWNDFDRLKADTKLLHNTRRLTQPWKTGLPIDFTPADKSRRFPVLGWLMRWRRKLFGEHALLGRYLRHPDRNQERFFFAMLKECLDQGIVTEEMIREEMGRNHVRHDAFEVMDRTPKMAA
ncbi:hypothetical protein ACFOW6_07275 [Fodinicurvata halophila]|uniref:Uncharacterized protein n=1 Tax=Fodinicurvata halophila TaxID=1419723 RepID=A0ABV8UJY3_9PROT